MVVIESKRKKMAFCTVSAARCLHIYINRCASAIPPHCARIVATGMNGRGDFYNKKWWKCFAGYKTIRNFE